MLQWPTHLVNHWKQSRPVSFMPSRLTSTGGFISLPLLVIRLAFNMNMAFSYWVLHRKTACRMWFCQTVTMLSLQKTKLCTYLIYLACNSITMLSYLFNSEASKSSLPISYSCKQKWENKFADCIHVRALSEHFSLWHRSPSRQHMWKSTHSDSQAPVCNYYDDRRFNKQSFSISYSHKIHYYLRKQTALYAGYVHPGSWLLWNPP